VHYTRRKYSVVQDNQASNSIKINLQQVYVSMFSSTVCFSFTVIVFCPLHVHLLRSLTRSIWKMLGPFTTASRRTTPVLHCHSPGVAIVARRHCRMPPAHRCPQQHRQRVTEATAMAPWNGPNTWINQSHDSITLKYLEQSLLCPICLVSVSSNQWS